MSKKHNCVLIPTLDVIDGLNGLAAYTGLLLRLKAHRKQSVLDSNVHTTTVRAPKHVGH
jgi:hypothetical protein